MENLNHSQKQQTNSEITNNLIKQKAQIKKRINEVNQNLLNLKEASDKLLYPDKEIEK